MKQITTITSDPKQSTTIILDDGTRFTLDMRFVNNQSGWFYDITYGTLFSCYGRKLVMGINLLRAFRKIIPFGLVCITKTGYDPVGVSDFVNGQAQLYVLDATDIAMVETSYINE